MKTKNQLVAIDDHWKSLGNDSDPHCHTWQCGTHIYSLPKQVSDDDPEERKAARGAALERSRYKTIPATGQSRLTRLWLQRAESVQQVLRVPGGTLAAALN